MCGGGVKMYNLLIDKLKVVFTIQEDSEMNDRYSCVLNFMSDMGSDGHQVWKLKYATRCAVVLGSGKKLLIQAGISHHRLYVKFEFNPTKLGEKEWADLYSYMSVLMDFGYHTLYDHGKVNYIEIAADAAEVEFDNIFAYDVKVKNANDTYRKEGSIYLGGEKSDRSIIVYDKAKEQLDKFGIKLDHPLLRIEARLAHLPLTLGELQMVPNPFNSFNIGWMSDLQEKKGGPKWNLFKKQCQTMGVQNALGMAGGDRKKILEELSNITSHELNPGNYWNQLPAALDVLKTPSLIY